MPYLPLSFTQSNCTTNRTSACASVAASNKEPAQIYVARLQKARDVTLGAPDGQLHGRAGRRCVLEDGERMLTLCLQSKPACLEARILLMQNLIAQNRGREEEVPGAALDALKEPSFRGCRRDSGHASDALLIIELGLEALHKSQSNSRSTGEFLEAVLSLVPNLAEPIIAMAVRLNALRSSELAFRLLRDTREQLRTVMALLDSLPVDVLSVFYLTIMISTSSGREVLMDSVLQDNKAGRPDSLPFSSLPV